MSFLHRTGVVLGSFLVGFALQLGIMVLGGGGSNFRDVFPAERVEAITELKMAEKPERKSKDISDSRGAKSAPVANAAADAADTLPAGRGAGGYAFSGIVAVGVTAENAIDVPSNNVGWYVGSARLGQAGASFLDGHTPGIFSNLHSIGIGNVVSVEMDGQVFEYRVVERETPLLQNVDMRKALYYGGGADTLVMMTCAGTPVGNTYSHRLVVYAVRV